MKNETAVPVYCTLILRCWSEQDGAQDRRFPFNGLIDETMIFDRTLTAEEALTMYQNFEQYKQ